MEHRATRSNRSLTWIIVFIAFGIPAIILRTSGMHVEPLLASLLFGIGIVGGAFLLSWAAEVAQLDVSASFAIA
ncbi:MAG: sodium:proton exchanger, partial [Chloroflexi bacterium]|nr:sodium:proton exchanger [Chloroflexota bacterium]